MLQNILSLCVISTNSRTSSSVTIFADSPLAIGTALPNFMTSAGSNQLDTDSLLFPSTSSSWSSEEKPSTSDDSVSVKEEYSHQSHTQTASTSTADILSEVIQLPEFRKKENLERISYPGYVTINGYTVPCVAIHGEPRIPLSACLKRIFRVYNPQEVQLLIEDLRISQLLANENEFATLKALDEACVDDSKYNMHLISRSDIERVLGMLRSESRSCVADLKELNEMNQMKICHNLYTKKVCGDLFPKKGCKRCIRCSDCSNWFTPEDFVCHNHSTEMEENVIHWGLDSSNWRFMLTLDSPDKENSEKLTEFLNFVQEDMLEPMEQEVLDLLQRHSIQNDHVYIDSDSDGEHFEDEEDLESQATQHSEKVICHNSSNTSSDTTSSSSVLPKDDPAYEVRNIEKEVPSTSLSSSIPEAVLKQYSDLVAVDKRTSSSHSALGPETSVSYNSNEALSMKNCKNATPIKKRQRKKRNIWKKLASAFLNSKKVDAEDPSSYSDAKFLRRRALPKNLYAELYDKELVFAYKQTRAIVTRRDVLLEMLTAGGSSSANALKILDNMVNGPNSKMILSKLPPLPKLELFTLPRQQTCMKEFEQVFELIKEMESQLTSIDENWRNVLNIVMGNAKSQIEKVKQIEHDYYVLYVSYNYARYLWQLLRDPSTPITNLEMIHFPSIFQQLSTNDDEVTEAKKPLTSDDQSFQLMENLYHHMISNSKQSSNNNSSNVPKHDFSLCDDGRTPAKRRATVQAVLHQKMTNVMLSSKASTSGPATIRDADGFLQPVGPVQKPGSSNLKQSRQVVPSSVSMATQKINSKDSAMDNQLIAFLSQNGLIPEQAASSTQPNQFFDHAQQSDKKSFGLPTIPIKTPSEQSCTFSVHSTKMSQPRESTSSGLLYPQSLMLNVDQRLLLPIVSENSKTTSPLLSNNPSDNPSSDSFLKNIENKKTLKISNSDFQKLDQSQSSSIVSNKPSSQNDFHNHHMVIKKELTYTPEEYQRILIEQSSKLSTLTTPQQLENYHQQVQQQLLAQQIFQQHQSQNKQTFHLPHEVPSSNTSSVMTNESDIQTQTLSSTINGPTPSQDSLFKLASLLGISNSTPILYPR